MAGGKKKSRKPSGKKSTAKSASNAGAADATIEGRAEEVKKKKSTSPFEFIQQVRNEGSKVTWTTWGETWVSTVMVLIMVVIMAIFLFGVDQVLRGVICNFLPIDCVSTDR